MDRITIGLQNGMYVLFAQKTDNQYLFVVVGVLRRSNSILVI